MVSPNVIKKFTCEICEKAFSTNKTKKHHISNFHGKVKKFECNVCSKTFGQNAELMGHIENNHKIRDQKCKFCAKKFGSFERLNKHIIDLIQNSLNGQCTLFEFEQVSFNLLNIC